MTDFNFAVSQPTPEIIQTIHKQYRLERCRFTPWDHQIWGVHKLVTNPWFALLDEMGAGKTLQVIIAAQVLYLSGIINKVVVLMPASIKTVWFDPELGELAKHLWEGLPSHITWYHGHYESWTWQCEKAGREERLYWTLTNYEWIRNKDKVKPLLSVCGPKTLLICDESTAIKSSKSLQSKGAKTLRKKCGRVILLNGTPIANSLMDLYNQGRMLHDSVHGCTTKEQFKMNYVQTAVISDRQGNSYPKVIGYKNIEDLQRKFAPYVLRRLKEDCLDLPEKLPPVAIHVPLTQKTWDMYCEMRDEMVLWLKSPTAISSANQVVVKAMRLAQITSGFVGGVEAMFEDEELSDLQDEARPSWMKALPFQSPEMGAIQPIRWLGSEKHDYFVNWVQEKLQDDETFKLLVRVRFRPELERVSRMLSASCPKLRVGELRGGSGEKKREAIRLLDPRTADPLGSACVLSTSAGAFGHNLTAAHTVFRLSRDYSYFIEKQFEDRVHREGQKHPVSYYDLIASGPKGQKTIDHQIAKKMWAKQDLAELTTGPWVQKWIDILEEE